MSPQSILAYLFMLFGNYYYKNNFVEKTTHFDVFVLAVITFFVIKWNGRIDMSSFNFNNYTAFIFIAISAFVIIYKCSFLIERKSSLFRTFLIWAGKRSLNIFLVHPFLLAIVPYILIANFNVKDVFSKQEYLILIYLMVFLTVYFYQKLKTVIKNRGSLKDAS